MVTTPLAPDHYEIEMFIVKKNREGPGGERGERGERGEWGEGEGGRAERSGILTCWLKTLRKDTLKNTRLA